MLAPFARFLVQFLSLCIPVLLLVGSIRLRRRFGGIGLVILGIGLGAILLGGMIDVALALFMPYVATHHGTAFVQRFWGTCTPDPWVGDTGRLLPVLGVGCLLIGFVWFSFRGTRNI